MPRKRRVGVIAASLVLLAVVAGGALVIAIGGSEEPAGRAYYVAPGGSDGNPGTSQRPFRTIAKGLSVLRSGATTYVRTGEYDEVVKGPGPQCSSSAPCRLRSQPGERPVLKGLLWLDGGEGWEIDGIDVTWSDRRAADEHMVKVVGGSDWTLTGMEIAGARSFANLLVAGEPRNWRVVGNCIHDTYPSNATNQDHNVYVNLGSDASDGVIEGNLIFSATNGSNIKLGGPDETDPGASHVAVIRNTLYNAAQNVLVGGRSHDISFEGNITAGARLRLFRAYRLTGDDVVVKSGLAADAPAVQYADPGFREITIEHIETVRDPRFDAHRCGALRPGDAVASRYGAYAR